MARHEAGVNSAGNVSYVVAGVLGQGIVSYDRTVGIVSYDRTVGIVSYDREARTQ
jgi:hypothetical protein